MSKLSDWNNRRGLNCGIGVDWQEWTCRRQNATPTLTNSVAGRQHYDRDRTKLNSSITALKRRLALSRKLEAVREIALARLIHRDRPSFQMKHPCWWVRTKSQLARYGTGIG